MKETVLAYAKINLSLDVLGKRPDGYHDLESVMQTVSLFDEITLDTRDGGEINLSVNWPFLVSDERNLAHKAARLFFEKTGIFCGLDINIQKNIPIGAGLGGGSSNAAAVLSGLNKMFGFPKTDDELSEIAFLCGADVPFCLKKGTCLAAGLGEKLTPLPPLPGCYILIAKPDFSFSTKSVFESLCVKSITCHPNTAGIINALYGRSLYDVAIRVYNVMEETVRDRYRSLDLYKGVMLDCGALGASMTGSGPAVFGIFTEKIMAENAAERFSELYVSSFITKPLSF